MLTTTRRALGKNVPFIGRHFSTSDKADMIREQLTNKEIARRTVRDAIYLFIDTWTEVKRAHKSYDDFHAYLKSRASGKDMDEDKMDNIDIEIMRKQLNLYHAAKSPLTAFDLRWFYWMYLVWFVVLLHGGYQAYQRKQAYQDMLGDDAGSELTIEERRKKFGGGYIEDVRK